MKYFSIEEMTRSEIAKARNISNEPNASAYAHIVETINKMLDPIREAYGKPVSVTSGYRSQALNNAVGGASNSSHKYGYAADIKPAGGSMKELQKAVLNWAKSHRFDQIIFEQVDADGVPAWVHVGWKHGTTGGQRRQILTAKKVGNKWVYAFYK